MKQRERILQQYHNFHYISFAPLRDRRVGFFGMSRKGKHTGQWMIFAAATVALTVSIFMVF